MKFEVNDKHGNRIAEGSEVTSFRGEKGIFHSVIRGQEIGKTAKVHITWIESGFDFYGYASVCDLHVVSIPETLEDVEQKIDWMANGNGTVTNVVTGDVKVGGNIVQMGNHFGDLNL